MFTGSDALSCISCSCAGRAREVLDELPGGVRGLRALVDDRAGRVDRREPAGRALGQRRDAEVDAGRLERRHQPRAVGLHGGLLLLERVAGLGGDRGVGHDLVLPDQVLEELDAAGGLVGVEHGGLAVRREHVAAVLPHERRARSSPCRWSRCRSPTGRPCRRRSSSLVSCLRDLDELRPVPGVVGVRDPGRVEHVLVVVEDDRVEVARQAVLAAVGGREVRDALVGELGQVVAVACRCSGLRSSSTSRAW